MPIVIEGPDNSGKSKLAKELATRLGSLVVHAGPKSGSYMKMVQDMDKQNKQLQMKEHKLDVFDRLTCISERAYRNYCLVNDTAMAHAIESLVAQDVILIYCRPPSSTIMDFSTHLVKAYDTEETMKDIVDNAHKYIARYDATFSKIPHLSYNWLDTQSSQWRDNFINSIVLYLRDYSEYQKITEGKYNVG